MSNNSNSDIEKDEETNKNDFDKFFEETDEIVVEAQEEAEDIDIQIDDDSIYEIDVYKNLISDLSIVQQNNPKIQAKYLKFSRHLIDLKNKSKNVNLEDIEDYPDLQRIYKNEFDVNWIIPIVLDKKKIYKKLEIGDSRDESVIDEYMDIASSKGIQYEDFYEELQKEIQYHGEFNRDKLSFKTYRKLLFDINQPYIIKKDLKKKDVGYQLYLNQYTQLLRYFNIDNKFWEKYTASGPEKFTYEQYDENKKIVGSRVAQILPGSYVNIIGFLVLGSKETNILDALNGEEWFDRIRKIGDATEIKKNEEAIVVMKNHGMKTGDKVMILNSNSEPSIDGEFVSGVKVINDNEFMVPINTSDGKAGTFAEIYTTTSLTMKKIELKKEILEMDFKQNYANNFGEEASLYLFPEELINDEEWKQLCKKVIPSANSIIKSHIDELKELKTIDEMDILLKRFSVDFRSIGFDNYFTLTEILDEKYIDEKKKLNGFDADKYYGEIMSMREKIIGKNKSKDISNDIVFGDKYLFDKDVVKFYGNYPYRNTDVDSISSRYNWILGTPDHGRYYFLFMEYQKIQELKNNEITTKEINERLAELKKVISENEKELKGTSNNKSCENRKVDPVKVYKSFNELYEDGLKETEFLKGDYAIIENNKSHENGCIYRWNGDIWEQDPLIRNLDDLCLLGVEKIKELDLEKLHCLFRKACKNKKQIRLEKKVERLNEEMKIISDLVEYSKKEIEDKLKNEMKIAELNLQIYLREIQDTRAKETIEMYEQDIDPIYKEIMKIPQLEQKEYLRNLLIKKDGILIDKDIYSIRSGKKICCGHYYYQLKIAEGGSPEYSEKMFNEMIAMYVSEEEDGIYFCNHDGRPLDLLEYDTAEGLSKTTGEVDRQRETVLDEEEEIKEEIMELEAERAEAEIFECSGPEIRNELLKLGFKADQVAKAKDVCSKINALNGKTGIMLKKKEFINIIIDVLQQLQKMIDFPHFRQKEITKMKKEGFDLKDVRAKIFTERYNNLVLVKKITLIASRLLIAYQTMIPPQYPSGKTTSVVFEGFDGNNGLEYLSLLIDEAKIMPIQRTTKNDKTVVQYLPVGKIKEEVRRSYDDMSDLSSVKKLKSDKRLYESKQISVQETKIDVLTREIPKFDKLPANYVKEVEKAKTFQQFVTYKKELRGRQLFLAQEIIRAINDTVKKSEDKQSDDPKSLEMSCCFEEVDDETNYYRYIQEKTDKNIEQMLKEARDISFYSQLFLNGGIVFKHYLQKNKNVHIPIDNLGLDREKLRKQLFLTYIDKGTFKGQLHDFKDGICTLTGQTKEDILKINYTDEEENELIQTIIRKSLKRVIFGGTKEDLEHMKAYDEGLVDNLNIEELQEESHDLLMKEINSFSDNMGKLLSRNTDKFKEQLENLGLYQVVLNIERRQIEENPNVRPVEIVEFENEKNRMRIYNLKNYINNYFRRYLSNLANNYDPGEHIKVISDIDEEKSRELQKYIYERDYFLKKFLTKKDSEIFKKLKFDVNYKVVANISANTDKWDLKYSKIEKIASFNLLHLSEVLLFILIKNLNEFIKTEFEKGSVDNNRIIAQFIMDVFEKISADSEKLDFAPDTMIEGDYRTIGPKVEETVTTKDPTAKKLEELNESFKKLKDPSDYQTVYEDLELEDKVETEKQKFIKKYKDEFEQEPTENEIIDFLNEYEKEKQAQDEEDVEDWTLSKVVDEDELEIGDSYGDMPQSGEGGDEGDF